jgi:hypothetical protein
MSNVVSVYKGRTTVVGLDLGYDISGESFVSEIREGKDRSTPLIASWSITYATDGSDGKLVLTLDDSVTTAIEHSVGYMDVKRITGSEPVPAFDDILEVAFKNTVSV